MKEKEDCVTQQKMEINSILLCFFKILTVFFPQFCFYIKNYFGAHTGLNQQVKYSLYLYMWKRCSRLNLARIYLLRCQI